MFRIISIFLPLLQEGCVGFEEGGKRKKKCDPKKNLEEYRRLHPYVIEDAGTPDTGTDADVNARPIDFYVSIK